MLADSPREVSDMVSETLKLVATAARRPWSHRLHRRLDPLLRCLADVDTAPVAERTEDEIWALWMHHPDRRAASELERATRAMVAEDFATAECILHRLVARHPDYAEAWHKRATLYYLQSRDDESLHDLHRTLVIEPRHYGAILSFAEICLAREARDAALFAFDVALRFNPHHERAREATRQLLAETTGHAH